MVISRHLVSFLATSFLYVLFGAALFYNAGNVKVSEKISDIKTIELSLHAYQPPEPVPEEKPIPEPIEEPVQEELPPPLPKPELQKPQPLPVQPKPEPKKAALCIELIV